MNCLKYSARWLYQKRNKITDINSFYFPYFSLKIISITCAMQRFFALNTKKYSNLFIGSFESHLVLKPTPTQQKHYLLQEKVCL